MQISLKKDSSVGSAQSDSQLFGCSSWDNSTDSHPQISSISRSLSLKMSVSAPNSRNTKQLCFQFQDQDSSSTQSTGQSDSEVVSIKDTNYGLNFAYTQSGYIETSGKSMGNQIKQVSSIGTQDFVFPSQLDFGQPVAHVPVHYAEPYFGGLLAAATYGPQAMMHHSQMVGAGLTPARVPLPLDHLTADEPIYVNAKQYRAILRRRQSRAKLEAQNKLVKVRKPYLHESRHLHALKRARGSGGRFLTAKEIKELKEGSNSTEPHLAVNKMRTEVHHQENYKDLSSTTTTTSFSEVTSCYNSDDIFQHQGFRFSGYDPGTANQHRISALR